MISIKEWVFRFFFFLKMIVVVLKEGSVKIVPYLDLEADIANLFLQVLLNRDNAQRPYSVSATFSVGRN